MKVFRITAFLLLFGGGISFADQQEKLQLVVHEEITPAIVNWDKMLDEVWELVFGREAASKMREDALVGRISKKEFELLLKRNLQAQDEFLIATSVFAVGLTTSSAIMALVVCPGFIKFIGSVFGKDWDYWNR